MTLADDLTPAERWRLRHPGRVGHANPTDADPTGPTPTAPPQRPVRDTPTRHRALAEELRFRAGVEAARPTPDGVHVRLAQGARLPPWFVDKAAMDGIALRTPHGPVAPPDGDELRRRREAAGLGRAALADALGIHRSGVRKVENGEASVTAHRAAAWRAACNGGSDD